MRALAAVSFCRLALILAFAQAAAVGSQQFLRSYCALDSAAIQIKARAMLATV